MRRAILPLLLLLLGAGCDRPPPEAYLASAAAGVGEPAGLDAKGGACTLQPGGAPPTDLPLARAREVFCGGWTQPAGRVLQLRGEADPARLEQVARGGLWRSWLDQRLQCGAPERTTLAGGTPAWLLPCMRRTGGWPHLAIVVAGPEGPVLADGIPATLPVLERVATGRAAAAPADAQSRSAALQLAAQRLAAEAFGSADVGRYDQLMTLGRELNQAEVFAAAEDAYRAALALQERALGLDNPNIVAPLAHLALNLSNQGRHQDAAALFARAEALAPRAADPVAVPRLQHYRGLAALNAGQAEEALALLRRAEAGYAALLPESARRGAAAEGDLTLLADPIAQSAVLGLAEAWRNQALALSRAGQPAEVSPLLAGSRALLRRTGLEPGLLVARGLRTEATANSRVGRQEEAARQLEAAARRFAVAAPGERPEAVTLFLAGGRRAAAGNREEALAAFRAGAAILRARQIALPVALVLPYLDALAAEAAERPAEAAALRAEMFGAAQLAQRSNTVRFVQQASARLGAAGGDPRVAEAVRRLQDADQALRALFAERDIGGGAALDARIAEQQRLRAEAEAEVAAAAPGYRQLLLSAVSAADVAAALGAEEAMVAILLGPQHGWALAVRQGMVQASRIALGEAQAAALVERLRMGVVTPEGTPGAFDTAAAAELHRLLLAPLPLDGVQTLVVAPDGPLLALPFGLLLTAPAEGVALRDAPWLLRRHAVVHVPSPQAFVTLRGAGAGSAAPLAYAGFGDFQPASQQQLGRSFPADRCAQDVRLAAGLGRLPGTRAEVELAQQLVGAGPQDLKLGAAFTADALLKDPTLGQRRILHLATHALLPGELSCLPEPAIVVSARPGAPDAGSAFLRASELLNLKLDADLVVLSACNTGGAGGAGGGEALSGLARAFFYAGARGLMVTHWAVDDSAAALTVADALRRQQRGASSAAALRGAQLVFLDEAGRSLPEEFAHPYFWAPFALIGDGRRAPAATVAVAPGAPAL